MVKVKYSQIFWSDEQPSVLEQEEQGSHTIVITKKKHRASDQLGSQVESLGQQIRTPHGNLVVLAQCRWAAGLERTQAPPGCKGETARWGHAAP